MKMSNFCEFELKVPLNFRKRLVRILKNIPPASKFEDVSAFIMNRYKFKLELFATSKESEVILDTLNSKHFESGPQQHSKDEIIEFKEYLSRVDFTSSISKLHPPRTHTLKDYVEIKIKIKIEISPPENLNQVVYVESFFNRISWKTQDLYRVYIGHIYDPSKIWIRFGPIEVFQKRLLDFYEEKKLSMQLSLDDISLGMDCVCAISDLYYRGRIVRTDIEDPNYFRIFLYDFGMVTKVDLDDMFCLDESFKKFPAAAVRARLSGISTLDHQMWTDESVQHLIDLTEDRSLIAQIVRVDTKYKILEINLFDNKAGEKKKLLSINHRLVREGFAKVDWEEPVESENLNEYKPLKDRLYLYPSFEMIENGITPSKVQSIEQLKECLHWDVIFPDLYKFGKSE